MDIFVGQLYSDRTSFTFDYYSLNWCQNTKGLGYNPDMYGKTQTGAPMHETMFEYQFNLAKAYEHVCYKDLTASHVNQFKFFIDHDYRYTLYLDDLPSAVGLRDKYNAELPLNYLDGIPVGFYEVDETTGQRKYALYNHFDIIVIINHTVEDH